MSWLQLLEPSSSAALSDGQVMLDYRDLRAGISARADWLRTLAPQVVALDLPQGLEWVLFDLACAEAGIPCVPLPAYFSADQRQHVMASAGVELVIGDDSGASVLATPFPGITVDRRRVPAVSLPEGTAKITFTSGSTGRPRGVCLSLSQQLATARSLLQICSIRQPVHLAVLPLATLLENIAGVYAPLLAAGTVYVPASQSMGFAGSRLQEPQRFLQTLRAFQPDSMILVPELLQVMLNAAAGGWSPPASLQFIAVGGARVSDRLLQQSRQFGLPVYQGYGLSECGSVVALNTPSANCPGSVGRLLPHLDAEIRNGELVVREAVMLGYLDDHGSWYRTEVATGDLVQRDDHGYFWFRGRRHNRIISSLGRNIHPEWPESELLADGFLRQAVVLGDGRPHCVAIAVPATPTGLPPDFFQGWLERINRTLPDYARIQQCLLLNRPMTVASGLFTANGRPNRNAITHAFAAAVEALYRSGDIVRFVGSEVSQSATCPEI